jgi:hypothetical protein
MYLAEERCDVTQKNQQVLDYETHRRISEYKKALAGWQKEQNFCLFGTLTWKYKSGLNEAQRKRALARFFNALDRKIYKGKGIKRGKRIERLVFFEKGRSRENLHAHFFCKSENLKQTKQIILEAHRFWVNEVDDAAEIAIDTNSFGDDRHGYGIKEYWLDDNEQLLTQLCHLTH